MRVGDQELIDQVMQAHWVSQWSYLKAVPELPTAVGRSRGVASSVGKGDGHRLRHLYRCIFSGCH